MQSLPLCVLLLCTTGGLAKQSTSGIDQFWTDDYKVFDQIYGKTSDKEIFGAPLPPSISYGLDLSSLKDAASEKKERFIENHHSVDLVDLTNDQLDSYNFGARYPDLTKQSLQSFITRKPTKAPPKFISTDFKPIISKNNDAETYNYLKHLESLQKQKEQLYSQINIGGFKPFLSYAGSNAEDSDGYKSIQDILEAHEANKGKVTENDETDDQVKYLTYGGSKGRSRSKNTKTTKNAKPRPPPADKGKPRCPSGRCRKRATTTYRGRTYLTRPYVRKIKHKIYKY